MTDAGNGTFVPGPTVGGPVYNKIKQVLAGQGTERARQQFDALLAKVPADHREIVAKRIKDGLGLFAVNMRVEINGSLFRVASLGSKFMQLELLPWELEAK